MKPVITKVSEYCAFLAKAYINLERKSLSAYPCKLNKFSTKKGIKRAHVGIIGQNVDIKIPITTLVADNAFEYFSPEDKKNIFREAFKHSEKYKLAEQYFCEITNQEMFVLQDTTTERFLVRSAFEISTNNEIIQEISSKSANIIGFVAGHQQQVSDDV
jgi:hypothetical protein